MEFTDEQIRALLRDPARHPPSARHLGFELIDFSVDEGWAEVAFTPRPEFANPAGMVQGGFVCAMLDDAMGVTASISQRFAITTRRPPGRAARVEPMLRITGTAHKATEAALIASKAQTSCLQISSPRSIACLQNAASPLRSWMSRKPPTKGINHDPTQNPKSARPRRRDACCRPWRKGAA